MPTPQKVLSRIVFETLKKSDPEPVHIKAIYRAVESSVTFTNDDLIPPNLRGEPVGYPRWKRNVRNALQTGKDRLTLVNHSRDYWRLPTPLGPSDAVNAEIAWEVIKQKAEVARQKSRIFKLQGRNESYGIGQIKAEMLALISTDSQQSVWLKRREVESSIFRFNAAGGRSGKRVLNYNLVKEQLIVDLHPDLKWSADRDWILLRERKDEGLISQLSIVDGADSRNRRSKDGLTGPGPSLFRAGSTAKPGVPVAYLLKLHGASASIFKVGYSNQLEGRIAELNKGLVSSVTGYSWEVLNFQECKDIDSAYQFEQFVIQQLKDFLVKDQNEIFSAPIHVIKEKWEMAIVQKKWS